uniref:Uncharacterized protein n=1 Tax=Romanomermis culicivorax TaxID=13658 RepID=A0A915IWC8_ROMCU
MTAYRPIGPPTDQLAKRLQPPTNQSAIIKCLELQANQIYDLIKGKPGSACFRSLLDFCAGPSLGIKKDGCSGTSWNFSLARPRI